MTTRKISQSRFLAALKDTAVAAEKADTVKELCQEFLRTSRPPPPKE